MCGNDEDKELDGHVTGVMEPVYRRYGLFRPCIQQLCLNMDLRIQAQRLERSGRRSEPAKLRRFALFHALLPMSRSATSQREAMMKVGLAQLEAARPDPIVAAMLDVAVAAERRAWRLGTEPVDLDYSPPGMRPNGLRRIRSALGRLDLGASGDFLESIGFLARDLRRLAGGDPSALDGCTDMLLDNALMGCAIPGRTREEVIVKFSVAMVAAENVRDDRELVIPMLDAGLAVEAATWGLWPSRPDGPSLN